VTPRRPAAAPTGHPPPPAPGSLGAAPELLEIDAYLTALLGWRDHMGALLDRLDARARASTSAGDLVSDVTLAYAVWQSISTRVDRLIDAWDGGRVGDVERHRIAELIWGRLGGSLDVALAVSFTEACVLADALVTRLQQRLDLDPLGAAGVGERVDPIREQLDRCRGYQLTPTERATVDDLAARLDAAVAEAKAGADRRNQVAAIEAEASRLERDLIVAAAVQASTARDATQLAARLASAVERARAIRDLAARCAEKVMAAPRLAVPEPATIGAVPALHGDWRSARVEIDAFGERLAAVARARGPGPPPGEEPLARRSELRGLLEAYRVMANRRGRAEDTELQTEYDRARAILFSAPLDLEQGAAALAAYEHAVRKATKPPFSVDLPSPGDGRSTENGKLEEDADS
jgi:hypothetical protein